MKYITKTATAMATLASSTLVLGIIAAPAQASHYYAVTSCKADSRQKAAFRVSAWDSGTNKKTWNYYLPRTVIDVNNALDYQLYPYEITNGSSVVWRGTHSGSLYSVTRTFSRNVPVTHKYSSRGAWKVYRYTLFPVGTTGCNTAYI